MQELIVDSNRNRFVERVNRLLQDGCRVVPGTFYAGSTQVVATPQVPYPFRLPDGSTYFQIFSVVLECDDEAPPKPTETTPAEAPADDYPPGPSHHARVGEPVLRA